MNELRLGGTIEDDMVALLDEQLAGLSSRDEVAIDFSDASIESDEVMHQLVATIQATAKRTACLELRYAPSILVTALRHAGALHETNGLRLTNPSEENEPTSH